MQCDEYQFCVVVNVTDLGGATSIDIEYSVDGGTPAYISGITTTGNQSLGCFDYDSEVVITLINNDDPLANITLGAWTNDGSCTNPCLPSGVFKMDAGGDLADLPDPAPDTSYLYFVATDLTGIGTWPPGSVLSWNDGLQQYEPVDYGAGIIEFGDPLQFWYGAGTGGSGIPAIPYPIYPVMQLNPTGNSPNNWELSSPDVTEFAIPLNTPFQVQVRNGFGPWTPVAVFTMQQLSVPVTLPIVQPFTTARVMWDYDTCGVIRYILISPGV